MGPSGTGLLPTSTLYANTNTAYVGKSSVANLGFQFTGSSFSAPLGSPIATSSAYSRNAGTAPGSAFVGRTYQPPEQSVPVWHAYHSSPTSESTAMRAVSPVGGHRAGTYASHAYEEEDPLNEIVNRVSAGLDRTENTLGSPFSERNLSINTFNNSGAAAGGYSGAYTPNRGAGRSFTTPRSVRGRGNMGLTEDRMEHVLNKYLESQEQM